MMQALAGYYHFEVWQYVKEFFFITFPHIVGFAMFAMFVQTLVPNKFIGHAIVIGVFVLQAVLSSWGWENTLLIPGNVPAFIYSDMNGYGHLCRRSFGQPLIGSRSSHSWVSSPWLTHGAGPRTRCARAAGWRAARLPALSAGGGVRLVGRRGRRLVLLQRPCAQRIRHRGGPSPSAADYERQFKKYETLDQPKLTAVDTTIDIFPARGPSAAPGAIRCKTRATIRFPKCISPTNKSVSQVHFDRPFHLVSASPRNMYGIYALDRPLEIGESLTMTFAVSHSRKAFAMATNGRSSPTTAVSSVRSSSPPSATTRKSKSTIHAAGAKSTWDPPEEMRERGDPRALANQSIYGQLGLDHLSHGREHVG